jgi:hypothetical protein
MKIKSNLKDHYEATKIKQSKNAHGRKMFGYIENWADTMERGVSAAEINTNDDGELQTWLIEHCENIGREVYLGVDNTAFSVAFGQIGRFWEYGHLMIRTHNG